MKFFIYQFFFVSTWCSDRQKKVYQNRTTGSGLFSRCPPITLKIDENPEMMLIFSAEQLFIYQFFYLSNFLLVLGVVIVRKKFTKIGQPEVGYFQDVPR